ncbi:GNAT family N-acetyltransferase [Methylophaga sp. OBS4]|uniref:GNAT family N-acetyltransferase n=1 Tax=Methylophaga sp. OBS4 TaxID=2991935 RepID=UPI00225B06E2|nr:GNAT family N-acetyltransferase [Methylophaga sp. OBS4]MCX4187432.1 GNAT family N-acetyltransferase [Methylophaga sp. OBS4]
MKQNDDDLPAIVALINEAYRGTGGDHRWTTEAHLVAGDRISVEALTDLINDSQCDFIVCHEQDKLIGCISICYRNTIAEFGTFAIKQEKHGMGIGKQLLAYAENHAKNCCQRFQVSVVTPNQTLIDFYIKRGYQPIGHKKLYPVDNNAGKLKAKDIDLTVLQKKA